MENIRCHDYTRAASGRSGWGIHSFKGDPRGLVQVDASGYREENGPNGLTFHELEAGDLYAVSLPDGTGLYEIKSIRYHGGEPGDTYSADIQYLQHVTGLPIMEHLFDPTYSARNLWWSARLKASADQQPEA